MFKVAKKEIAYFMVTSCSAFWLEFYLLRFDPFKTLNKKDGVKDDENFHG